MLKMIYMREVYEIIEEDAVEYHAYGTKEEEKENIVVEN